MVDPLRLLASLAVLAPLAAALPNEVHVVQASGGPGVDFTTLQAAVAAAQPGDILLLRNGTYGGTPALPALISGKALSVVADTGQLFLDLKHWEIAGLPAGSWSVVQGDLGECPVVSDAAGIPWLDAVIHIPGSVEHGVTRPALEIRSSPAVHLTRCNIDGDWSQQGVSTGAATAALHAEDSKVYCYGSVLEGGTYAGTTLPGNGGHGVELAGPSFLFALGSVLEGGNFIGGPSGVAGSALSLAAGSACWSVGSDLLGGGAVAGGTPGAIKVGPGSLTVEGGPLFGMEATSPVRYGANCSITVTGLPGAQAFLNVAAAPGVHFLPELSATIQIGLTGVTGIPLGTIPPSKTLTVHVPIPTLPTEGSILFLQAHFIAGSEVFLSGGQPVVLLSPSL